jgi:hypothetical protein
LYGEDAAGEELSTKLIVQSTVTVGCEGGHDRADVIPTTQEI